MPPTFFLKSDFIHKTHIDIAFVEIELKHMAQRLSSG